MSLSLYAIYVCFSLWDYYIPALGGRVLDYLGLVLLLAHLTVHFVAKRYEALTFSVPHLLFLVTVFPAAVIGIFSGEGLPVVAFLTGLLLIFPIFASGEIDPVRLQRQLGWLILINLGFFFLQVAAYRGAGIVLDYHSRFGVISPRVFNEFTGYFRAAGLFQEPNSFSINLFMLNALRMFCVRKPADGILLLSGIALLVSESLWGIGALGVLMLVRFDLLRPTIWRVTIFAGVAAGAAWAVNILRQSSELLELVFDPITVARLFDLENDPSRQSRFEGEVPVEFDQWLLLGRGIDTERFQGYMGANGVSFYIFAFGLLGMILFLVWLRLECKNEFIPRAAIILFAMTTYPQFTSAIWWAWLAVFLRLSRQPSAVVVSPAMRPLGATA